MARLYKETDNVICNHLEFIVLWGRRARRPHVLLSELVFVFGTGSIASPPAEMKRNIVQIEKMIIFAA